MSKLKIAVHQFNPIVGDLIGNTDKLIQAILLSKENGCDLFVSSELAICGYPPNDLLLRPSFFIEIFNELERLKQIYGITILIGCPYKDDASVYNSVFVISDGMVIGRYDKNLLPNYGVFDELRYFKSGIQPLVFECNKVMVGVLICEDMWYSQPAVNTYNAKAQIICVLNASPYTINKHQKRIDVACSLVNEVKLPLIYVNQYGGQDSLIFDGGSFAINSTGNFALQLPMFEEQLAYLDYANGVIADGVLHKNHDSIAIMYGALVTSVRDYVNKNGFYKVVLGLSGGIDSALTLAIAVDALGCERVMAVMMPSKYTQDISVIDAREMANLLKVKYEEISIGEIFNQFQTNLSSAFIGCGMDATEENLQARIRGTLLMAISNKFGYLVLTTGNKSEMATGYATLYGDMAGGFAVLKDVLKTQVYQLSNWRNLQSRVIPSRIISRPPSAELHENQLDQDSLPDYVVLDHIIQLLIEKSLSSSQIINYGYAKEDVDKVIQLVKLNEYKRYQSAIGPKISEVAFGTDWRYPITNHFKY